MLTNVKCEYQGIDAISFIRRHGKSSDEQVQKENLLKVKDISLDQFKEIIEENKITIDIIKNSSVNKNSILCFLIENEMFSHIEILVEKFGREILDYGSLSEGYNRHEGCLGDSWNIWLNSIWFAAQTHANKNNFQEIVEKIIQLNADVNLCSTDQYGKNNETILDFVLPYVRNSASEENVQKFKSIARSLLDNGAECADTYIQNNIQAFLSSLRNNIKNARNI